MATAVFNNASNLRNPYKFIGQDASSPGESFTFTNCYLWMRTTHLWKMIHKSRTNSVEISESPSSGGTNSEEVGRNKDNREDSSVGDIIQESEPLIAPPSPEGVLNVESEASVVSPGPNRPIGAKEAIEKSQATKALLKRLFSVTPYSKNSPRKATRALR